MARLGIALGALVALALGIAVAVAVAPAADGPDPWQGPGAGLDGWIYDDIDAGYAEARESGRPLLVVFR